MTLQEIRAAIAASPELQALAVAGSFGPIATALSIGRTKLASHFASERGVLERFPGGPLAADALISKLEAFALTTHPMSSIVRRALKFLAQSQGLDIGSPATQGLIDALLSIDVITQTERNGLRAMATVEYEITVAEIERAVREV